VPFTKADIGLDETKVEELKRLVEIGHSEYISPSSPAVLQIMKQNKIQKEKGKGYTRGRH